jgi:L-asparagine transporter-like permease
VAAVLSVASPVDAFLTMFGISAFGAMFTWMMIFVTHLMFRRSRRTAGARFPAGTLLGAALMAALIVTTGFTAEFRPALEFGVPFLGLMVLIHFLRYRRA